MFFAFFFIYLIGSTLCSNNPRDLYRFEDDTKIRCFYGTTSPVSGLDPVIWRQDEYGNLIMNGLNCQKCQGCLSYTFDHRDPVSSRKNYDYDTMLRIAPYVKSFDNCQVLSTRVNMLKASSADDDIENVVSSFGCDAQTMAIFATNNYEKARALELTLLDPQQRSRIQREYNDYKTKFYGNLDDEPTPDFNALRQISDQNKRFIDNLVSPRRSVNMNTLLGFLVILAYFLSISSATSTFSNPAWLEVRKMYAFDHQTKWDCFYRTTTPVPNMDPSVWRHDQYGNLLMATMNFNCKGCICYTFDHRYSISRIGSVKPSGRLIALVSSIHNCQALSFRANALKGGNDDKDVQYYIDRFGCDFDTMKMFEDKDHLGAAAVQQRLISDARLQEIHQYYIKYVNGPNFFDPKDVNQSKAEYFKKLDSNYEYVARKIEAELDALNKVATTL